MSPDTPENNYSLHSLFELSRALREPDTGCPWDLKQTLQTYKKYLQEEMQELIEAIDSEDSANLCEELGDNLMNLVFIAELAREKYGLSFADAVKGAAEKIIHRHPHVFGDAKAETVEDAEKFYYDAKATEKQTPPTPTPTPTPNITKNDTEETST